MALIEQSKCIVVDPRTGTSLTMQLAPTSISQSRSINLKSTNIPGASNPRIKASSASNHTISFQTAFFAEDPVDRNTNWVKSQVAWLLSLTFTRVVNEALGTRKITPVFLILGNLIRLPVYLTRVSPTYGPFENDMKPLTAVLGLEYVECTDPGEFVDAVAAREGSALARDWEAVNERGESLGVYTANAVNSMRGL